MSWLGVNLNDSLNNIKGQLTNLTKEVLTDDYTDDGEETEVVTLVKVKELQTLLELQKHEIEDLRKGRTELEERLAANDLLSVSKSTSLKKKINDLENELTTYRKADSEWGWDSADTKTKNPQSTSDNVENIRVVQLEKEITRLRDAHQHEILALQDHHKSQLSNKGVEGASVQQCDKCSVQPPHSVTQVEESPEYKSLQEKYTEVKQQNEQLQTNMEELDQQHQAAIGQILMKKKELQNEVSELTSKLENSSSNKSSTEEKKELIELESQNKILKEENIKLTETSKDIEGRFCSDIKTLKAKIAEKETLIDQMKSDIESMSNTHYSTKEDNMNLNSKINTIQNSLQSFSNKIGMDSSNNNINDIDSFITEVTNRFSEIKLEKNSENSQITDLMNAKQLLEEKVQSISDINNGNEKKLNEINTNLNEKLNEIQKLKASYEVKEIENEQMEKTIEQLKKESSDKDEKIKSIQKEKSSSRDAKVKELMTSNQTLKQEVDGKYQEQMVHLRKIEELESKNLSLEMRTQQLEQMKKNHLEEVRKLASSHDVIAPEDVIEVVRDTLQEKDSLHQQVTNVLQELKDAQDLLETIENEKIDLEKECEDLRDQLEELQCGERQQPEGSVAQRGLPTIQEEDADNQNEKPESEARDNSCVGSVSREELEDKNAQINQLSAESLALSESRTNLEMEKALIEEERDAVKKQLLEAHQKLTNMSNLEMEASNLRSMNEDLKKQMNEQNEKFITTAEKAGKSNLLEIQVETLENKVKELSDASSQLQVLQLDKKMIEQQLMEVADSVETKDEEIKYLEQKVETLKSHNITQIYSPDADERCVQLQKDLDNIRAQLIFKEDMIDSHQHCLKELGELFNIDDPTIRTIYVHIKSKYLNMEHEISTLSEEVSELKEHNESLSSDIDLNEEVEKLTEQKEELEKTLACERENSKILESKLNEQKSCFKKVNDELMKEFESKITILTETQNGIKILEEQMKSLESEKNQLKDLLKNNDSSSKQEQSEIISLKEKINLLEKEKNIAESKATESVNQTKNKEIEQLNQKIKQITTEKDEMKREVDEKVTDMKNLSLEKDIVSKQLNIAREEMSQTVAALNQKHQESVSYHAELQKLSQLFTQERQKNYTDYTTLNQQFEALKAAQKVTQESLLTSNATIDKLQKENPNVQTELNTLKKELESWKNKASTAEHERDQLRVANSTFNTQYQEQSKEFSVLKEKESQLNIECDRLKQHLVKVEETYTNEALRGEEREATLRATLSKLEDKLNNHSSHYNSVSQRANIQVETLQDTLQQMTAQRDDAVNRLQHAEETSEQHQQSLVTLQQVLHDFRKSQDREIAEATEREKKQVLKKEKELQDVIKEKKLLQEQIDKKDFALASQSILQKQVLDYQQRMSSLQAQVATQEALMKQRQTEVSHLKSNSDSKVDKDLVKNLLVGYFATPMDKRTEVLRVIATVLDLSPEERIRTGLDAGGSTWLSSIANFLAPPPSNIQITSKVDVLDSQKSITEALIEFIDHETNPRQTAKLPAVEMAKETEEKASKKAKAKLSSVSPSIATPPLSGSPLLPGPIAGLPTFTPVAPTEITTPTPESANLSTNVLLSKLIDETRDKAEKK